MFEKYIWQEGAQIRKRGLALIGQKTGVGDQWESSSTRTAAPFFPPIIEFSEKDKEDDDVRGIFFIVLSQKGDGAHHHCVR